MPENSTCIPIASLAQLFISAWYSGSRGRNRRNSPTAIASAINTPDTEYRANFNRRWRNCFIGRSALPLHQDDVELILQIQRLGLQAYRLAGLLAELGKTSRLLVQQ